MPKFKIIQSNPSQFKNDIFIFWKEYLPGTPSSRLEWMDDNPAGSAIWLFAIEEKSGELAGTISLFPKDLFINGKSIKVAVVGDFMLHNKFRVFGPALDLLKGAKEYLEQGVFDFLYTIPNPLSQKIAERVGFRPAHKLQSLVCPQQCDFLIKRYAGIFPVKVFEKPLLFSLKLFSRATYARCRGVFEEIDWKDKQLFGEFCQRLRENSEIIMQGNYDLSYLDWRYLQNPEFDFQIFTFKKQPGGDILGLFVFVLGRDRLQLYDMAVVDDNTVPAIISMINDVCSKENLGGVYFSISENHRLLPMVKKCCFLDTKDKAEIYTFPENIKGICRWNFTSADRNI